MYEVNLPEDHVSVPGSSHEADAKVRRQEEMATAVRNKVKIESIVRYTILSRSVYKLATLFEH